MAVDSVVGNSTTKYTIGDEVKCNDRVCGEVYRVVIDPVARVLTHLVVEPKHQQGQGRLVPIELVDASAEEIHLRCSAAEFDGLQEAEETHFLSGAGQDMGYGAGQALAWPYFGLGAGIGMGMANVPQEIIEDRVPAGEVQIRRGDSVHASDGDIGRVKGLVIDPKDHHVTHVLLEEGHLWGKREIAIPIGTAKDIAADGVRLDLTRDEVCDLPPVDLADDSS